MAQDKVIAMVLETTDYSKFKVLEGNRSVIDHRKGKIRKSIKNNGLRFSPIIVNEKMEIIDGQGRFEVSKECGYPIKYIISPGMTLDDCIVLNSSTTGWSLNDYIDSYVAQGNSNYSALKSLMTKHPQIPLNAVFFAVSGNSGNGGKAAATIREGQLQIDKSTYDKVDVLLGYAERFLEKFQTGNKINFLVAVMFCYNVDGVDREKLFTKWDRYALTKTVSTPVVKIYDALDMLERAYNFKSTVGNLIYFSAAYDKYCRERNNAYATRWSKMKEE